jgi:antitoxin component of MazEF toxin-antitoxin module
MLKYYRSIQRPKNSCHVNIPESLVSILDLKHKEIVSIELANDNSNNKSEKIIVIRKIQD